MSSERERQRYHIVGVLEMEVGEIVSNCIWTKFAEESENLESYLFLC